MTLSQKLHYLMLSSGVSQIELSNQIKIERSTLTRILNNSTTQPKIDTIYTLAKYFNVDVVELLDSMQNINQVDSNIKQSNIQMVLKKLMITFDISNASTLSRKTGLPTNALRDILNGKTVNPKIKTLQVLANFFNVSIPQLCGIDTLPEIDNLISTPLIQKMVPLLNFDQIEQWLAGNISDSKLPYISVNVHYENKKQYAVEIQDNRFFPDFLTGNILLIDSMLSPIDNDLMIVLYNKIILIYQQIKSTQDIAILRQAGTKTKITINYSSFIVLGTIIQQIINRN